MFSLIETILLVKELMKSSLLKVKGKHGSTEIRLFVSLATVLKTNLGSSSKLTKGFPICY